MDQTGAGLGAAGIVAEVGLTRTGTADRHVFRSAIRALGVLTLAAVLACAQTSGTARGVVVTVEGDHRATSPSFSVLVEGEELALRPGGGW